MPDVASNDLALQRAARLDAAQKLISLLQERDNVGRVLHAEGDRFVVYNFQQAAKCCETSASLALRAGDTYARAASQFHLGLYYFVWHGGDWDRAANLCKDAALIFHAKDPQRAEGVAYYAAARILQEACKSGQDRWEAALGYSLRAVGLLQPIPDLKRIAAEFFYRFNIQYTEYLASTVPPSPYASASTDAPPPDADARADPAASADPRASATASAAAPNPGVEGAANANPSPPAAETPDPKSRPRRQPRHYHLPARLNAWAVYMTVLLGALLAILLVNAGIGIYLLSDVNPSFAAGLFLSVLIIGVAAAVTVLYLEFMEQLRVVGRPQMAAVIVDATADQIFAYLKPQTYWLRPFRELVVAWLPLDLRETQRLAAPPPASFPNATPAHLTVHYCVEDAAIVWDAIGAHFSPHTRLGIPFPLRVSETESQLTEYAGSVAVEQYARIMPALQNLDDAARSESLRAYLGQQAGNTGIHYRDVQVRTFGT